MSAREIRFIGVMVLIFSRSFATSSSMKPYINREYGFRLEVPKIWVQSSKQLDPFWRLPNAIEIIGHGDIKLVIERGTPITIDSGSVEVINEFVTANMAPYKATLTNRYLHVTATDLQMIEAVPAVVYHFSGQTDMSLAFANITIVLVLISSELHSFQLTYYVGTDNLDEKDRLLSVIEDSYQTFTFIPLEEGTSLVPPRDNYWHSIFFVTHHDALRDVYKQARWNNSALRLAESKIRLLAEQRLDFFEPQEEIAQLAEEDTSENWRLYLNIFHNLNFLRWYPTKYKKNERSAEEFIVFLEGSKDILSIKVTDDNWRNISYSFDTGGILNLYSNLGSGLNVAEIAGLIYHSNLESLGGVFGAGLSVDNKQLREDLLHLQKCIIGKNITLNWPEQPCFEDNLFLLLCTTAIFDISDRLRLRDEVMQVTSGDVSIDAYVHRDEASFIEAVGEKRRAFARIVNGLCEIHVIIPDSLLGYESSVFKWIWHGEETMPIDETAHKCRELEKRLLHTASRISATISHELDHALLARERGKPIWLLEGQATYFGEMMDEMSRAAIDLAFGTSRIDTVTQILTPEMLELLIENMHSTRRAIRYTKILRNRIDSLVVDFKDIVLLNREQFYNPEREVLNYALAWGVFKTIMYVKEKKQQEWMRYKSHWERLISTPHQILDIDVISGEYDLFFEWTVRMAKEALDLRG